jgi:hypothetical protein
MVRFVEVPPFFREPRPGECGEPKDFIRVKDANTTPEEWRRVMKRCPYVLDFGTVQVAVRHDKWQDPEVMGEVWRVVLAQPMKGPPALLAQVWQIHAKYLLRSRPEVAVLFARAAQAAKPSTSGAALLRVAEAALDAVEPVIH